MEKPHDVRAEAAEAPFLFPLDREGTPPRVLPRIIRFTPMNKKDPAVRRTKDIKFAVNESEHSLLSERAKLNGKVLATYCREVALKSNVKTTGVLNREVWGQLGKAYSNINQAIKLAHTLRLEGKPVPPNLLPKLEAELEVIRELRSFLKS